MLIVILKILKSNKSKIQNKTKSDYIFELEQPNRQNMQFPV